MPTEKEYESRVARHERHRVAGDFMDVRLPQKPGRPQVLTNTDEDLNRVNSLASIGEGYNPSDNVQNLLNNVRDRDHRARRVFSELDVLKPRGTDQGYEWRESARWVKYEEVLEEGGKRWSKPHVASLSMYSLFELRNVIKSGSILMDIEAISISQVVDILLDEWVDKNIIESELRNHMRDVLLVHHKFAHTHRPKDLDHSSDTLLNMRRASLASITGLSNVPSRVSLSERSMSVTSFEFGGQSLDMLYEEGGDANLYQNKPNAKFMRKIPKGANVANVMVGEVEDLDKRISAFIRLKEARILGELSEVSLPTKFMFIILGPKGHENSFFEIGRCISTMMVDDIFREVAYKARDAVDLIAGLDEFTQQVTVLPPTEWDPKIRLEPPQHVPDQTFRKSPSAVFDSSPLYSPPEDDHSEGHADPTLVISCRPFLGLIKDIKRKVPWYISDYKDALHIQCIASFVYIFLATLTPNVTFGGLLGEATEQYMGVMECILAAAVTGVLFALFAGQPLNILGSTGPMLVLEMILFNFCKDYDWEFLPFRFWIGMWTCFFILMIVMWDLSALVRYITRFTEESFATLIAVIFIVEAFRKLFEIESTNPVWTHPPENATSIPIPCSCGPYIPFVNTTLGANATTMAPTTTTENLYVTDIFNNNITRRWDNLTESECGVLGGVWTCYPRKYVPDVFFFSLILYAGTFGLSIALISFKTSNFLPSAIRQIIADFAVLIAIIAMVLLDYFMGLPTPKLIVPEEFKPTAVDKRGWIVPIISEKNPWWLYLLGAAPALLSTILIFMDQQITAVIVNRKENKLQKGNGYHLDMFVLVFCVGIHSLLGLPWYVAATVSAIAHIQSLRKESECTAPGDKPTFLGVREQRVTALLVAILSGVAVLLTSVLKFIPMAVLYGVFFYMGFAALRGMQFINRILLIFMPMKYQPDYPFLRHVKLWKVHMLTFIQILCLVLLWIVKAIKSVSIAFPLMVLAIAIVRKFLDYVYTQEELKWIDDILPGRKPGSSKHHEKDFILKDEFKEDLKDEEPEKNGHINEAYTKDSTLPVNGKASFFVGNEVDTHM